MSDINSCYFFKAKEENMNRLERLFFIVSYLTNKKSTTAKELAQIMDVSKRTVYRDIDVLSTMNIPVFVQPGRNGGIQILDTYKLSKSIVNEKEQLDVLTALQAFEDSGLASYKVVKEKLSQTFGKDIVPTFNIDFSGWGKEVEKDVLHMLSESIKARKVVKFTYINGDAEITERSVIVVKVNFKKNAWYVDAFDLNKKELRLFKVSRATNVSLADTYSEAQYDAVMNLAQEEIEFIELSLKVHNQALLKLREELQIQEVERLNEQHAIIKISQPSGKWLLHYLLSFGSSIEVLSPVSLRKKMIEELVALQKNYQIK